jgi:adenosylcobyric acid synthase
LYYSRNPEDIATTDVIILPGTKNTMADLLELRRSGLAQAILQAFSKGKKVIGICGGYQMLGESLSDPWGVEGDTRELPGLGLLPIRTELSREKQTLQRQFQFKQYPESCRGYEIHMGSSQASNPAPLNRLGEEGEGYYLNEQCWGTYMHGIFDNSVVIDDLLQNFRPKEMSYDYQLFKEENYEKLARLLEEHLQVDRVLQDLSTD